MKPSKKIDTLFWLIILLYIVYSGIYIYRTSFVVEGQRYFVLFDDAMISMRYARNLADGYGLVWNPGEKPVEGYTNPLWVVYMALFHLLPIPASKISVAIQISGAVFLITNLHFIKRITLLLTKNKAAPYLATILTAFYMPLNNWGLQGMEVSLLSPIISAGILLVIKNLKGGKFSPWPYAILGFGTLVRIDVAVPYLAVLCLLVILDPNNRRLHLSWGISLLVLFIGGQTLVRYFYYGNPLPNTYYLKMGDFPLSTRIKRGVYVLILLIRQMNWVLVLLPFTILFYRRDQIILILFLVILGQIAYSVYVGGDAWEHRGGSNRYIALAMPLFFILFVYATGKFFESIESMNGVRSNNLFRFGINAGFYAFVILSMINFNFLTNTRALERWLLIRQPNFIEANKEYIQISNNLLKFTTPEARIAVVTAGAIPYFTGRPSIDLLGKNDPVIAHQENHLPANIADICPGHMKWDYDYTIGQLKPDVVVQLWGDTNTAKAYLQENYTIVEIGGMLFSVLTGSQNIMWNRVAIQQ